MTTFNRIKLISKERGFSLLQLNEKAGFKPNIIYSWNKKKPSAEKLRAVAEVLGVSVDYLIGKTDNPIPNDSTKQSIDINDDHVLMTFDGKPIPEEDMELIKRLLRGKE